MKIQQPGKSTPINSNRQLDKKEFYQAIQKYGETAKTDGTSTGNVATFLQKAGNAGVLSESIALQTQLTGDNYAAGTAACSTFVSACNVGYIYDSSKASILTTAANYATNCCKSAIINIIDDGANGKKWSNGTYAKSCNEYRNPNPGYTYSGLTGDGIYTIDPDGAGGNAPFQAYCDMTNDSGGWTLVVGIDGANKNHQNSAAVTPTNLNYISGKGKFSDTDINAIATNKLYKFNCIINYYYKLSNPFTATIAPVNLQISNDPNSFTGPTYSGQTGYIGLTTLLTSVTWQTTYNIYGHSAANGCYGDSTWTGTTGSWGHSGSIFVK